MGAYYVRTHHTFPLRSLLLPILTEDSMYSVVNSLPHLEECPAPGA